MAKRVGKYNIGKHESKKILKDGGTVEGNLTIEGSGNVTLTGNVTAESHGHKKLMRTTDATETYTAAMSGQVHVIDPGGARVIKTPAPAAGLHYKWIMKDTDSNDVKVTFTSDGSSAADIGIAVFGTGLANGSGLNKDIITFGDSSTNHTEGDWMECWCDGTNWFCTGRAVVASSITLA